MATTAPTSRPSRWPWIVLGVTAAFAAVGLVFVSLNGYSLLGDATNFIAFMGMGIVGALSLSRAPDNRIGWLLLWVAVTVGAAFTTGEASIYAAAHGEDALAGWLAWPGNALWTLGLFPLLILLPLVFPDGRLPSPRWRWLAWAGVGISFLAFVTIGFGEATFEVGDVGQPVMSREPPARARAGPARTRRIRDLAAAPRPLRGGGRVDGRPVPPVERRRTTAAQVVRVRGRRARHLLRDQRGPRGPRRLRRGAWARSSRAWPSSASPSTVGIAILQYRLWDLDVVVKKTLVAGTLVVLALAVYAGAVALIGAIDRRTSDRPALLFAIALGLGIAFRPAMRIGRRVADRLVYGRRATPYEVLTEFSERVGDSYATEDVLPRMAQVLGEGSGAEVARVWLRVGPPPPPAAAWPADAATHDPVARLRRGHGRSARMRPPSRCETGASCSGRCPSGCPPRIR